MGISFKIDTEEGVIYSVAEGKLGFEDLKTYMETLRADSNFSTNLVHIFEIRMAQQNISELEIKALASALPVEHTKRFAIVAHGVKRDLALKYKESVKGLPVEVFTDFNSAWEWVLSD